MEMKEKPVILSVIIPVYNAENTIREALDSLLGQSLKEIEVICVDDGSKDRSVDVIREYLEKDPRVSLITQKNQFAGAARNAGIDAAKGEYLFFLDADDYVLDYALEAACAKARKHRLDCLKFLSLTRDEKTGAYVDKRRNSGSMLRPEDFDRLLKVEKDSPLLKISVTPWSGIYRRSFVLEKNCRFNRLRCVNDRSFYNKIMTNAERIMITRDRVTVHRENQDQSLVGRRSEHFDCQLESIKLTEKQMKEDGVNPDAAGEIMLQEYRDLVVWYRRFSVVPERKAELTAQVEEYLDSSGSGYSFILTELLNDATPPLPPPAEVRPFYEPSSRPEVTVLVPVLNGEDTLNRALDCLTNQTAEELEFLLLYMGGSELSLTILKEYAAVDRRFVVVDVSGDSYGQAMNRGLEQARGKYIGILEPRDCIAKDMYEHLMKAAKKHRTDMIRTDITRFRFHPDGGKELQPVPLSADRTLYGRTLAPAKRKQAFSMPSQTGNGIYSRDFLLQNGIRWGEAPGTAFARDSFWFLTLAFAHRAYFVKDSLYLEALDEAEDLPVSPEEEEQIVEEYRLISKKLSEDPARQAALAGIATDRQFSRMLLARSRVLPERRRDFTLRMHGELQGLDFDRGFLKKGEIRRLDGILNDPENTADQVDISVILPAGQDGTECLKTLLSRHDANTEVITDPEQARGAWCICADAGSFYGTDTLDRIWRTAEAEQPDMLIFPGDLYDPDKGAFTGGYRGREEFLPEKRPFAGTEVEKDLFRSLTGWTGDKLFRTDYLRKNGLLVHVTEKTGGTAVVFAAAACAGRISLLKAPPLYHRVVRPDSPASWEEGAGDGGFGTLTALKEHLKRLGLEKRFERDLANYGLHYSLRQLMTAPSESIRQIYDELKTRQLNALGIPPGPGEYYYDPEEYALLKRIYHMDADAFMQYAARRETDRAEALAAAVPEEDPRLRSASYRIGQAATWLPRKLRTGSRLIREHGFRFVLDYGREKGLVVRKGSKHKM